MKDEKAQKRTAVILEHLGGRLNATEAARELGVSRKTFYDWLERARKAIFQAMEDRPTGRPPHPEDSQNQLLLQEVKTLEKERTVLAARLRIQEAARQAFADMQGRESAAKKKERP